MARAGSQTRLIAIAVFALVVSAVLAVYAGAALADPGMPGPVTGLVSPSHPDDSVWYSSANPSFSWNPSTATSSAIAGYSFIFDQKPLTIPDTTSDRVSLSFLPRVPITVGSSPTEDRVVDLNGDGKLDVVLENSGSNTISVLMGNGDGTFQPRVDYATGAQPWSMDVGDVNGDGKLDVVTCDLAGSKASVLINNGDGTFKPKVDYTTGDGSAPECLRLGDVNGDGRLDILTANAGTNNVGVLLNDGNGTFGSPATFSTATHPTSIDTGDLNGDGKLDLVTANYTTNNVSVLMGNGDGTFQPAVNYACGSMPETIAVSDLNRDGHPDVVTVNYSPACASILLNNGNGTLAPKVDYATGDGPYSLDVLDLNHDSVPDLVTVNHAASTVSIMFGNGDGTFTPKTDLATGNGPFWVALGDLTGDGYGDMVTTDQSDGTISVYTGSAFLAASFPGGKADGTWYFHVRAVDSNGVGGAPATRRVNIDTTKPTTTADGLSANNHSGWQTTSQLVTLHPGDGAGSGLAATYYTLDGGAQQTYSAPFTVSGQASHVITYWSVDRAGNTEDAQTGYVNIDTAKPSTSADGLQTSASTGWQTTSQLVTLHPGDTGGSGLVATYYTLDGGAQQTYSGPFTVSGSASHTVVFWSVDHAGNTETAQTGYVNIDTDAPTTTADGLSANNHSGWQTTSQLVTLHPGDGAGSGLAATYYTLDGGAQQTYSAPFTVSGQASHVITYWSVDRAGNTEDAQTGYVNIGVSLRQTTASGLQQSSMSGWQNHSQQVTLSAAGGSGSGLAATYYTLDGNGPYTYSAPFTVSGQASHVITYWSTDEVGNPETAHTGYVNIDITAPTVTADAPSGWSAVPVTVQLHPADTGGSGATSTQYRLHGATGWTSATGDAFTVPAPSDGSNDGAHVYDFQAFDAAGNVSATGSCAVDIDTTAPAVTSDADAYWHNSAVIVHLAASDSGAGMVGGSSSLAYRVTSDNGAPVTQAWTQASGAAATITVSAPPDGQAHTFVYTYQASDAVGKQTTGQFTVRMDTRRPATSVSGLPAGVWTNMPVALVFAASPGDGAPIARTEYSLNGGATWMPIMPTASRVLALTIATPGVTTVLYRSVNTAGTTENPARTATISIDTGKPACFALKNVKAKAKRLAKLTFRIKDPAPSCGAAKVTITIYRGKKVGKKIVLKVAKRITINSAVVNKNLVYKYKVRLKKGSYAWRVAATDAAGNTGTVSKLKKLTVK